MAGLRERGVLTVVGFGCAAGFAAALFAATTTPGCGDEGCSSPADCDDGVFCNGAEICMRGTCYPNAEACDDDLPCNTDTCDEATDSCAHTALDADADTFPDADCGGTDCDDEDPVIHPGAAEVCNGLDDDCDGEVWEDHDGDHHRSSALCPEGDDCNDDDPTAYEGAPEPCEGGDQNCSGGTDDERDTDGDTVADPTCGGTDCDDEDPAVGPDAEERCNGRDDDCDERIDEVFPCVRRETGVLCWTSCGSAGTGRCTDACELPTGAACEPPAELCRNGLDDDCDGDTDEGCATCTPVTEVCDGVDNDCDGDTDEPPVCEVCPVCQPGSGRRCDTGREWGWGSQGCAADGMAWEDCTDDVPPAGCGATGLPIWSASCCYASGECCEDTDDANANGSRTDSYGLGCRPPPPCT